MLIPALSEGAGKHNKVYSACVCFRNGYVLGNNGSDNAWFVSAVFIPPNPYRPGDKLRAISYNRKRLNKRSNLYDFDTAVGNVSTEGTLLLLALSVSRQVSDFAASCYLRVRRLTTLLPGRFLLGSSLIAKCDTGGLLGAAIFGTFCPNICSAFLHIPLIALSRCLWPCSKTSRAIFYILPRIFRIP